MNTDTNKLRQVIADCIGLSRKIYKSARESMPPDNPALAEIEAHLNEMVHCVRSLDVVG